MRFHNAPRIAMLLGIAVALLVGGAAGCADEVTEAGEGDEAGVDTAVVADTSVVGHDRFIEVIVALREAERVVEDRDSAAALFEARRDSILDAFGVTAEGLAAYLRARGGDADYLSDLWDTINQRLKHLQPGQDPEEGPMRVPFEG